MFCRWSEWRKWDLHVHTKDTAKNDQFSSVDFNSFCIIFFKKALENNVEAIWITDYFSINNYKKVKDFVSWIDSENSFSYLEKEKIKKIFLLPNVELRMLPVTDNTRLVNIHCLFNPDYENDLDNDFFSTIEFSNWWWRKYKMNRQWIIDLGKNLDSSLLTEKEQYEKWVNNFVVTHESLQKLYDENVSFRENTIIVVSNSSQDWASAFQKHYDLFEDVDTSSLDWVRKAIYCISKWIFSWNKSDREYFLWLKKDDKNTVIQKCWSLKPCIHWSDAHTEDKLFSPDDNRFCWIKADTTFEWLKQIIYEPEDRVIIQETKPEEKENYQIIDKVKFIDDSFFPEEILINQNLTTIIGWKSTGKSILLRSIAETIDVKQVAEKIKEIWLSDYKINDFSVIWRDWQESKKWNDINKKIIYIPQSYLNRLTDDDKEWNPIDEIIKSVLEKEDNIKNNYTLLEKLNRDIEKKINQNIENIFYKEKDIKDLLEKIKNIWDKKWIELEIKKLKEDILELKIKSWMTDKEISDYNDILKKITNIKDENEIINKDLVILKNLKENTWFSKMSFVTSDSFRNWTFEEYIFSLSTEIKESLENKIEEIKNVVNKEWIEKVDDEYKKVETQSINNFNELEKLNKTFIPLLEKAQKSKSIDEKTKKLEDEERKLKTIIEQENNLKGLELEYKTLVESLSDNHSKFFDNFFNAKTEILKQEIITKDHELEFWIDIIFRNYSFQENFINEICDQRRLPQFKKIWLQEYTFINNVEFKKDLLNLIKSILDEELFVKKYSKKEAITKLTQNWYIFDYKIRQNWDEISQMSQGKKSFVLLKLLIELDNSRCPILLDQPEDDLDNRSIYNDLVKFIKTKKKERQIIIATHNPNLVVSADSECVIVANQNWDKTKNKIYKFEYIEWALENTFLNEISEYTLEQRWIQEHVCDILEWWKIAFEQRKKKYNI